MYHWACALASGKIFAATLQRCNSVTLRHFTACNFFTQIFFSLFRGAKLLKIRAKGKKESVKDGYFFRKGLQDVAEND